MILKSYQNDQEWARFYLMCMKMIRCILRLRTSPKVFTVNPFIFVYVWLEFLIIRLQSTQITDIFTQNECLLFIMHTCMVGLPE